MKDLADGYSSINDRLNSIVLEFTNLKLNEIRAREFATHGFPRRIKVMARCIVNVFEGVPPERTDIPSRNELTDATINIQSFVFNVFGALDNLAWIWMHERGQKGVDGRPILDIHVGLGPKNKSVRATLSAKFQKRLLDLDEWFVYLFDLRHALAHRIPLYIPPFVVDPKDSDAYNALEKNMIEAINNRNADEYDILSAKQLELGRFRPWMQHSFSEGARPVVFHAQMLADFKTIDDLAVCMIEELRSIRD